MLHIRVILVSAHSSALGSGKTSVWYCGGDLALPDGPRRSPGRPMLISLLVNQLLVFQNSWSYGHGSLEMI